MCSLKKTISDTFLKRIPNLRNSHLNSKSLEMFIKLHINAIANDEITHAFRNETKRCRIFTYKDDRKWSPVFFSNFPNKIPLHIILNVSYNQDRFDVMVTIFLKCLHFWWFFVHLSLVRVKFLRKRHENITCIITTFYNIFLTSQFTV